MLVAGPRSLPNVLPLCPKGHLSMPTIRVDHPTGADELASTVEQIEAGGGTVSAVTDAGDAWLIVYTAKQSRPANTKARQTR